MYLNTCKLFIIIAIALLYLECDEVYRLRSISVQSNSKDVSWVVERILWNSEQAAIKGNRCITYSVKPEDNVSEICQGIKKVDRKFKIEKNSTILKISW